MAFSAFDGCPERRAHFERGIMMIPDRTETHIVEKIYQLGRWLRASKRATNLITDLFLVLFAVSMFLQSYLIQSDNIGGILAQFQMILSVSVVAAIAKKGFLAALAANLIQFLVVINIVFIQGAGKAAPGLFVTISTILILMIIYANDKRLISKLSEISSQKVKIEQLYTEVAAAETECSLRNEQLVKNALIMKETENKLNHMAFFDLLTELPNRKMILDRMELLIRIFKQQELNFAFVYIDLDNFKRVNDSMGHEFGDDVLKAVADRLRLIVDPEDIFGHIGGDEFALIMQRQMKEEDILNFAEKLRCDLLMPFVIDGSEFIISGSIGISMFPQDGDSSVEILKCADTAMFKAKDYGKNCVQFFRKEMKSEALQRVQFENKMVTAIQNDEFFLYYQPQYSAADKQLRGFEALARWHSPEYGDIRPDQFIPMAEESGYIVRLGEWILRTACLRFKKMEEKIQEQLILSINISAAQIMSPVFIQMVKKAIRETEISPGSLEFEVTESILMSSMEYVIGILVELKSLGIHVALDDFGTGYSSLQYLQMLPIDTLKIDKSFVETIDRNLDTKPIVGSIISLVHEMDIKVIAEGVENEIQLEYLRKFDCDYIQGFLWGKPLDEDDLYQLLQINKDSRHE